MTTKGKPIIGYAAFDTFGIVKEYSFELPKSNGNDNQIYVVFNDDNRHDAEISMERQFGEGWRKEYKLRRVEIKEVEESK